MRLSIAKHIRSLRKRAGLTQEELAQRLYVDPADRLPVGAGKNPA